MATMNLASGEGLASFNEQLKNRGYVEGYFPSQADVTCFRAFTKAPDDTEAPHVQRWYEHMATLEKDFDSLPGDASRPATSYIKDLIHEKADEEIELFASDNEDEAAALKQQRVEEYKKKKESQVRPAAKSMVTLDVKPWENTTNMEELENAVRGIEKEGLVWGQSQLVAVGFGVKKLRINVVVEDEKISVTELQEEIEELEEWVQSSDVAAMMKL